MALCLLLSSAALAQDDPPEPDQPEPNEPPPPCPVDCGSPVNKANIYLAVPNDPSYREVFEGFNDPTTVRSDHAVFQMRTYNSVNELESIYQAVVADEASGGLAIVVTGKEYDVRSLASDEDTPVSIVWEAEDGIVIYHAYGYQDKYSSSTDRRAVGLLANESIMREWGRRKTLAVNEGMRTNEMEAFLQEFDQN
jgi:hypothetical protein